MARYGVLGDIHGNVEALEAALAALDARGIDRLLCVGDLIGYNADPDACVEILQRRGALCIAGNHDLIGTGRLGFERCSNKAMHSLKRTRQRLGPETAQRLETLPSHVVIDDGRVLLTHGGVRDVQQYMTRAHHFVENARYLAQDFPGARICFYGHTHEQRIVHVSGEAAEECATDAPLSGAGVYFVNPGSVDASRKREHKLAEYAVFDTDSLSVTFAKVPYDERATEAKAEEAGFRIDRWRDRLYDVQRRLIGPRQVA